MADARLGQVNPLSLIGRSAVAPQSNEALAALTKGAVLQKLTNQGGLDVAKQRGIDTRRNTLLPQGINLGPTGEFPVGGPAAANLEELRGSTIFDRNLGASAKGRRAGISPILPKGGTTAAQLPGVKLGLTEFPGVAQARAAGEVELIDEDVEEDEIFTIFDKDGKRVEVPLPRITKRKRRTQRKAKRKAGDKPAIDLNQANVDVLKSLGFQRGIYRGPIEELQGKTVIFQLLPDGRKDIISVLP